jgi:4-diphosphocytidyl-2-C-methyl-D-erythritol kinase
MGDQNYSEYGRQNCVGNQTKQQASVGRVTIHCPAKVNLGLEVLHRRADGYHDICTVMQAIDLYDELTLEVMDGDGSEAPDIEVSGSFADEVPATGNTLLVAWAVAGGNRLPALKLELVKNIPASAGLGGGSSDGAGMLVALRELQQMVGGTGVIASDSGTDSDSGGTPVLPAIGVNTLRIGSDCPFFLNGGTQLAQGRGEQLTPIDRRPDFHLVVGVPNFGSATGPSYSVLGRRQQPMTPMLVPQLARSLARGDMDLFKASIVNDFEPVLRHRHPEYVRWFDLLTAAGAVAVSLTGSGSGFFGVFAGAGAAESALAALAGEPLRYAGTHRPIRH